MFEGPHFTVSGKQLTNHQGLEDSFPSNMEFPPGQSAVLVKTKDELIEAIRLQVKDEVDAIKVSGSNDNLITPDALGTSAFSYEEFKIIADETHRLGKICSVHARSKDAALDCARAGFDNLFHASYIDDEGIEAALRNKCVITPTLTLLVNLIDAKHRSPTSSMDATARDRGGDGRRAQYKASIPLITGSESGWSPVPFGTGMRARWSCSWSCWPDAPAGDSRQHAGRYPSVAALRSPGWQARSRALRGHPGGPGRSDGRCPHSPEAELIRFHLQGWQAHRSHAAAASATHVV